MFEILLYIDWFRFYCILIDLIRFICVNCHFKQYCSCIMGLVLSMGLLIDIKNVLSHKIISNTPCHEAWIELITLDTDCIAAYPLHCILFWILMDWDITRFLSYWFDIFLLCFQKNIGTERWGLQTNIWLPTAQNNHRNYTGKYILMYMYFLKKMW